MFVVCTTGVMAHQAAQKAWIIAAVKNTDAHMMTCVWQESEYHIKVSSVTHGAHIEHL
jgi:hypothetical protein